MPTYTVLVTDCVWPDRTLERDILAAVDAVLIGAATHIVMALRGQTPPHLLNPAVTRQANYRVQPQTAAV